MTGEPRNGLEFAQAAVILATLDVGQFWGGPFSDATVLVLATSLIAGQLGGSDRPVSRRPMPRLTEAANARGES